MSDPDLNMIMAVVPTGVDPATHYAAFAGQLAASWSSTEGLLVWCAADAELSKVFAPMKAAMKFVPAGGLLDGITVETNTVLLQTWPAAYPANKEKLNSAVPVVTKIENIDEASVRTVIESLYSVMGRNAADVDAFMSGNGLTMVNSGMVIGSAALGVNPQDPGLPNYLRVVMSDSSGAYVNPVQFLTAVADTTSIDKRTHPILSQLSLDGWVEIVCLNEDDSPLVNEPYVVYFSDETTREGMTDGAGRIFEDNVPAGDWAIDLLNHPSFTFID
jgi:hypothetical protein